MLKQTEKGLWSHKWTYFIYYCELILKLQQILWAWVVRAEIPFIDSSGTVYVISNLNWLPGKSAPIRAEEGAGGVKIKIPCRSTKWSVCHSQRVSKLLIVLSSRKFGPCTDHHILHCRRNPLLPNWMSEKDKTIKSCVKRKEREYLQMKKRLTQIIEKKVRSYASVWTNAYSVCCMQVPKTFTLYST